MPWITIHLLKRMSISVYIGSLKFEDVLHKASYRTE